jgi:membrane fusion protein, multidrug efflux system
VRAPISGLVGRAEITAGNLVAAGQTLLTTVVSFDPIYVSFDSSEQAFLKYNNLESRGELKSQRNARNPVWAGLADEQGTPHEGVLAFLDNELDPNTGTIHARGLFANKDRRFTPGMFARVKLIGSGQYDALLINDSAVGTDQSVKFVLKVGADNKIEYTPVKLGPVIDGLRVVREGLKANDVIVVKGLQMVRPGMPVTPQLVAMGEPRRVNQDKGGNTLVAQN